MYAFKDGMKANGRQKKQGDGWLTTTTHGVTRQYE